VDLWQAFLRALWLFLPCYMANMSPVAAARLFPRWNQPLDGGRFASDGRPLLGPHKTWRGLAAGAIAGGITVGLEAPFARGPWTGLDYGLSRGSSLAGAILFGAVLGVMALVGDAAKSYLKRRVGRDSGTPWFPFDQLDFVVSGLLGVLLAAPLVGGRWALDSYFGDMVVLTLLILSTPLLHFLSSVLAYWAGLKKAPW
jgi:CDP-2,3-bis-(O-geranylgeranyl)-sn-glycerol synthase